ncbi:hypothetical protein [Gallaecimonas sp. GXIMD4217]|uniref:hypothetical protein n=1 Tax=Gallaecimonas sp. GXIMD4217 TaxID=3131927 RepID=UPI00311B1269
MKPASQPRRPASAKRPRSAGRQCLQQCVEGPVHPAGRRLEAVAVQHQVLVPAQGQFAAEPTLLVLVPEFVQGPGRVHQAQIRAQPQA